MTITAVTPDPAGTSPRRRRRGGGQARVGARAERWAGLVLASPALVVFVIFMFVPLILTFWYSLHSYRGFGSMKWIGFTNFTDIAKDPTFWSALLNTILFTAISVPVGVVLGLGAAVLLDKIMPARGLYRALFYVPVVISGVAAGIIFLRLFDPLIGILNQFLTALHLPEVDWQGNGTAALVSIIVGGVIAVDMETAAVAAVCARLGVPWSAYRGISDRLVEGIVDEAIAGLVGAHVPPSR